MNEDNVKFINLEQELNTKHKMSADNQAELFISMPYHKGVKTVSLGLIPYDQFDMWKDMITEVMNKYYWR